MAYNLFKEVESGRRASVDQKYQRTYSRVFVIRTDSSSYGPYYAGSHPSLPAIWSSHPEDALAFCTSLDVQQENGDPYQWRITANYAYYADQARRPAPAILLSTTSRRDRIRPTASNRRCRGQGIIRSRRQPTKSPRQRPAIQAPTPIPCRS